MITQIRALICGLLTCGLLVGCNGPTESGLKARADANERVNSMNARISYDQARQAFEVGRFERALREIDNAIARYPEAPDFHILRGRIFLETHRLEAAMQSFMTALEKDQSVHEAHYYAAIVYQRWSDDEAAYEHYLAASELEPSNPQYLLAAAESLVALGELQTAKDLVEPRLDYFEHNAACHHLLGQIEMLMGNVEAAVERYGEAWLLNPEDPTLLEELARVQYEAGQYPQCYESVKQLQLIEETERTDLMLTEARCLALMGRTLDARNLYLKLSQLNPSNEEVWVELGTVAWELGDYARVAQCSVQVTALTPNRFEGYVLRAIHERHRGNLDEAIELLREAARKDHRAAMPHILLGLTLQEKNDYEGALVAFENAVEAEPDNVEARRLLDQLSQLRQLSSVPVDS